MTHLINLIEIIEDYLIKENISVNEFSERADISGQAVSKWLSNEYFPSVESAVKVAGFFNVSLDYLFGLSANSNFIPNSCSLKFIEKYDLLRKEKHESSYTVARACGFQQATVSKWRNGKQPKLETLIKLAEYFGCSLDFLVGREN